MTDSFNPIPEPREPGSDAGGPALDRLERDRKPGELDGGMMSGSDEGGISATERFQGELTPEEALAVLAPEDGEMHAEPPRD